jgi:hypothetical protein
MGREGGRDGEKDGERDGERDGKREDNVMDGERDGDGEGRTEGRREGRREGRTERGMDNGKDGDGRAGDTRDQSLIGARPLWRTTPRPPLDSPEPMSMFLVSMTWRRLHRSVRSSRRGENERGE